ncbi:MAG: diguanylate cyclase [Gallionella sp.]|nr:MAG: diguanylate cyclase [Gallionella sp.]
MSNDIKPEITGTAGANNLSHPVVLLVDDQTIVAEAIRRMLADETDIEFHYCQEPARAVGKANEIRPTIILQDLVMPEVDGYTLLKFYRGNPATSGTPVIVLSSREDPKDKSRAFENGASDYLVKLPDRIELIARIRAHSKTYLLQLQRDEAYREMKKLQEQLTESNSKLEESNATLLRLSTMDGLTGIANRRHFDETLLLEWKAGLRENRILSIIILDIDFFKKYNDGYGHQGGDDCLKEVAKTLRDTLHRAGDFIARYGGEEFVAILPHTDAKGAAIIAEHMRANIAAKNIPHAYSNVAGHVSISLGVAAMYPDNSASPADLIARADGALYKAKEQGRNRYIVAE